MAVLLLADGGFEGDGVLRDFLYLAHAVLGNAHLFRDFPRSGFPAVFLQQNAGNPGEFVDGLHHMHGDTDGTRLIGDRAGDRLTDPPGRIRRELESFLIIEFFHRLHQSQIAFLNEIEKEHAPADIALCNRHHQPEVGFGKPFFRGLVPVLHVLGQLDLLVRGKQRHFADIFEIHLDGVVQADVGKRLFKQFLVPLVLVHDLNARFAQGFVNIIDLVGVGVVLFHDVAKRVGGNAPFHFVVVDDTA